MGTNYLNKNADKYPRPPSARSNNWSKTSIYYVLKSRSIFGEWQPTRRKIIDGKRKDEPLGDPIENYYMPIATENEFYRIKAMFDKNTKISRDGQKRGGGGEKGRFANLYRGLTKCWECSTALVVKKGYSHDYLVCNNKGLLCNSPSSVYSEFEKNINSLFTQAEIFKRPEKSINNRLDIIATEAEITKQNDIINKKNVMIDSLGDHITTEILGRFAKDINNASIRKTELIEEIEKLKSENDNREFSSEDFIDLDLAQFGDRETYNKILSKDVELISRAERFAIIKRKDLEFYAASSLDFNIDTLLFTSKKMAEDYFISSKKQHSERIVNNYTYTVFKSGEEGKWEISRYLKLINEEELAKVILNQLNNGEISNKRALRLISEKHNITYPFALILFEGIFKKGTLYKRMNFDCSPIWTIPLNKVDSFKQYIKIVYENEYRAKKKLRDLADDLYNKGLI